MTTTDGEVRVPELGESVLEATVGVWLKQAGDAVASGEPLVQLETEKVNLDVAAEQNGVLREILRAEGETVAPGDVLAIVGAAAPAGQHVAALADRPHASPVARRLAEDHGVDLAHVAGTGTGGRVTRDDPQSYLNAQPEPQTADVAAGQQPMPLAPAGGGGPSPAAPPAPSDAAPAGIRDRRPAPESASVPASAGPTAGDPRGEERQRLSPRRLIIAQRLVQAQQTAALLTTFNEVDMAPVMEVRARRKERFLAARRVGLGFISFFTKAAVGALKAFPLLNAELQGEEVVLKHYNDIGVAVGVPEGLVVPVVRDADRKSFAEIEREIAGLAAKARQNTLTLPDLRGGTFTITDGGVYGSLLSTPILSPPQVGILGMHAIQDRPVVRDGQVVVRPMMYLALTYDHRLVDGREAVQFLVLVKQLIEDPERLFLEG